MNEPSDTYSPFDIVKVPFPFTDLPVQKRRPALVLSTQDFHATSGHTLFAMITSKTTLEWPYDIPLTELATAGLRVPCIIRMKLFTLDNKLILGRVGKLCDKDQAKVKVALSKLLPTRL